MNASKFIVVILLTSYLVRSEFVDFLIGTKCFTKTDEEGTCEDYRNCNHLIEKLKHKQIRIEDIIHCNLYLIICCPPILQSTETTSTTTFTEILIPRQNINMGRISEESKKSS